MPAHKRQMAKRTPKPFLNHVDKVGPLILKDLAYGNKSESDIAKTRGVNKETVSKINVKYGIRSEKEARQIGAMAAGLKHRGPRGPRRERKPLFGRKKKANLLERHNGALIKTARISWSAERIRRKYAGDFDLFLEKLKKFVFKNLDLYNPEVLGRDGKTATPFTWMVNGAKLFCLREYRKAGSLKEKQMPLDKEGLPIAQTKKVRTTKEARLSKPKLNWIPHATNRLLEKLGMDTNEAAKLGFLDIKKQIIGISKSGETGLTKTEKEIVRRRLEGQRIRDIAQSIGKSTWTISTIESSAAKKIKGKIKRKRASNQ